MLTRRVFLQTGAAVAGASMILPYAAMAEGQMGSDMFKTASGTIEIHPVSHASFVMQVPGMVIYNDPVGGAAAYDGLPAPDLIVITHHHGDHYDPETLAGLMQEKTVLLTNGKVYDEMPEALKARASMIKNGESTDIGGVRIEAIPAYNTTEDRLKYHPKGRDNGYVMHVDGMVVYIAGDTEDIPEMRALRGVDIAFLPMNLPYTMDVEQASSAVAEFKPKYVYPYHYKGAELEVFSSLVADGGSGSEVKLGNWYGQPA